MAFELAPRDPEPDQPKPGELESSGLESSGLEPETRQQQPPKPENSRKRYVCPYLGLSQDRTVIAASPTLAHACYAQDRSLVPSIEHQRTRCFSATYPQCTYYPDPVAGQEIYQIGNAATAQNVSQTPGVYALKDKVEPARRNLLPWIIILLILIGLTALAYAYANGMIPTAWLAALPQVGMTTSVPTSMAENSTLSATSTIYICTIWIYIKHT